MVANVAFASGLNAVTSFNMLQRNSAQQLDQFAKTAQIVREVEYFKKAIGKVTSVDDLMKDRRLLSVALSAFGMDEEINYPGRMKKVLESSKDDPSAIANRLADGRFREISQAFAFGDEGMAKLQDPKFIEEIAQKYVLNEFEKALGANNPALREATYFLRNIGNVTSPYEVLGDKVLRSVVTFTLNLPAQIAVQSIESQARLISSRFDIDKFKDTESSSTASGSTRINIPLDDARKDQKALTEGLALSTKAISQVDSVIKQLELLKAGYGALDAVQDPAGEYAAEIPTQEAAIPGLVRQQGLLAAARESLGRINGYLGRMETLTNLAADPANASKLDSYKTEFAELRDKIGTAYNEATYSYDDGDADAVGTIENLLDGSLANISVQYKSTGESVTIRSQDLTSFLTQIDQANTSFQNVTGAGDAANLSSARGGVVSNKSYITATRLEVQTDLNGLTTAVGSVEQFGATLNSASLYPGAEAIRDAGARLTDINLLLGDLRGLTSQSANLPVGADRSTLQTKYDEVVGKISDLINTTTAGGVDNLLAGGDQNYELLNNFNVLARGRDLNTSVLAELTSRDITSLENAQEVLTALDKDVAQATNTAFQQITVDSSFFNLASEKLDPRAAVDSAYRKLANSMEDVIAGAESLGRNLLSSEQSDVSFRVETTGRQVTIKAISNFDSLIGGILRDGADGLPSDGGDASGAIAKLDEALFDLNRVRGQLNGGLITQQADKAIVDSFLIQETEETAAAGFTDPYSNSSDYALEFIQRFLTLKDAEATNSQLGLGTAKNAYVLNLVQPLNFNFDA
ncbi:MAG: DUF1217 domain-containing protein [Alphaproteobacteria bacterium]|nr:DUF1217 domain-containing protein [Alphaproteobacteria bacterium]MBU0795618.1 DUF1217 domain-containing protein [Alphaproteobacteria bacterium]MBU0887675.1 DUF1217 domain-containing protein [Alphaproteobacteria bacterium]